MNVGIHHANEVCLDLLTTRERFQWVVCQLNALGNCFKIAQINRTLQTLPRTLDDTYARILSDIEEEPSRDATTILEHLTHAEKPLHLAEVAEIVGVDLDTLEYSSDNLLRDPRDDILTICKSLVTIEVIEDGMDAVVKFTHFLIKEYLTSEAILSGPAARYCIDDTANDRISQTCLIHLVRLKEPALTYATLCGQFPYVQYAARHWMKYAERAENEAVNSGQLESLALALLQPRSEAFTNSIYLDYMFPRRYPNVRIIF